MIRDPRDLRPTNKDMRQVRTRKHPPAHKFNLPRGPVRTPVLTPSLGGASAAIAVPLTAGSVWVPGPLYPKPVQVTDVDQGELETCHGLATLLGVIERTPELVGELIWSDDPNTATGVGMAMTANGRGIVTSVSTQTFTVDRWVSSQADSIGKAPYVSLWTKILMCIYAEGDTPTWDLLAVPRDPIWDIYKIGFNAGGVSMAYTDAATVAGLTQRPRDFVVGVTLAWAPNLAQSHVYLVEHVAAPGTPQGGQFGVVVLRNTWGFDGPAAWGDVADGRIVIDWPTFVKNMDALRWSNGTYAPFRGDNRRGTAPRSPYPMVPGPISPVMP